MLRLNKCLEENYTQVIQKKKNQNELGEMKTTYELLDDDVFQFYILYIYTFFQKYYPKSVCCHYVASYILCK